MPDNSYPGRFRPGDVLSAKDLNKISENLLQNVRVTGASCRRTGTNLTMSVGERRRGGGSLISHGSFGTVPSDLTSTALAVKWNAPLTEITRNFTGSGNSNGIFILEPGKYLLLGLIHIEPPANTAGYCFGTFWFSRETNVQYSSGGTYSNAGTAGATVEWRVHRFNFAHNDPDPAGFFFNFYGAGGSDQHDTVRTSLFIPFLRVITVSDSDLTPNEEKYLAYRLFIQQSGASDSDPAQLGNESNWVLMKLSDDYEIG